jgi:hypothetical protein
VFACEFKGAYLESMTFKFLAGRMREAIEQCAPYILIFQMLMSQLTHDLYLDIQIPIQNVLGNALDLGRDTAVRGWA